MDKNSLGQKSEQKKQRRDALLVMHKIIGANMQKRLAKFVSQTELSPYYKREIA